MCNGMRACMECGNDYVVKREDSQFCSRHCKGEFANRRAVRGAELYDMFMANQYDRGLRKTIKFLSIMSRMAMYYRREDEAKRPGFQSWVDPRKILERKPYLKAQRLPNMKIGRCAP